MDVLSGMSTREHSISSADIHEYVPPAAAPVAAPVAAVADDGRGYEGIEYTSCFTVRYVTEPDAQGHCQASHREQGEHSSLLPLNRVSDGQPSGGMESEHKFHSSSVPDSIRNWETVASFRSMISS